MAPSKVVVVGDVNGQIEPVFQKLGALHAKTKFAFAIIAGNLFKNPDETTNDDAEVVTKLVAGKIDIPLPTYFSLGHYSLPEKVAFKLEESAGELCPNLYFLGKRTTTKTSEGIKLVALGGASDLELSGVSKDQYSGSYSEDDAKSLKGANHADILITSEWPDGIRKGSKLDFPAGQNLQYRPSVAELCTTLKPRYHFTTSPSLFYEREPFFHLSEEESETFSITRFISLAAFGNSLKQRWIYAFTIDPTAAAPLTIPTGTTTTPLSLATKKRAPTADQNSFRYSNDQGYSDSRPRKRHKHAKRGPPAPEECFFCLSNPDIATQLITSIGTDVYLTTAKGPLTTEASFPKLEFPGHILIIPLIHTPTLGLIQEEGSRTTTAKEMHLYRSALNSMLKAKSPDLASVTWEVSRANGVHIHWQWLPVPASLLQRGLVSAAFKVEAENQKYPKFDSHRAIDESEPDDYFRVLVWDPATGKDSSLVLPLDESFRFDLQFGRRVLAKLLELDRRADWHDCGQSLEDEERDATRFKEAFKEFDFSLEE
ncbi:hypothetical protein BT63DRAFT_432239 [Microthyrium microscopicum]|uniref:CwfJ domain-containing protein n=1 Tax=Microthyrium microscopicum TaxID=703497 RepID=A0A6A6UHX3_9PEZI|nr:hypothetical protein BT63DRAFT_432239 [Microthyrium microscopicum]